MNEYEQHVNEGEYIAPRGVIEQTCAAAGIDVVPSPCEQCDRLTEMSMKWAWGATALQLVTAERDTLQRRIDAMLAATAYAESQLDHLPLDEATDDQVYEWLHAIRDAGKAVQP